MSLRLIPVKISPRRALIAVLLLASACTTGGPVLTGASATLGGGASTSPTPAPTATPTATPAPTATPVPTATVTPSPGTAGAVTVAEGSVVIPGGYIAVFAPITFSQAGSLDFSADWTSSFDDIDIALANGACSSDQLSLNLCTFAGLEESATLKPEQLTLSIRAATFTPLIGNFTAPTETVTYRILFTPAASASSAEVRALLRSAAPHLRGGPVLIRAKGSLGSKNLEVK